MMRMDCNDDCADFMVRLATSKKTVVGPKKKQKSYLDKKRKIIKLTKKRKRKTIA